MNLTNETDFCNFTVKDRKKYLYINDLNYEKLSKWFNSRAKKRVTISAISQAITGKPNLNKLLIRLSQKLYYRELKGQS